MSMGSCSHIRNTVQPASVNRWSVSRSRAILASIFSRHHAALFLGQVPCAGQPCQKQPSRRTAVRDPGKTISTVRREFVSRRRCSRNRSPRRWSSDRKARSRGLSRPTVAAIRFEVAGATASTGFGCVMHRDMVMEIEPESLLVTQRASLQARKKACRCLP